MTALSLADTGEAADLAGFLARLLHYDRAAAVRLQTGGGVLAVFGRPASFEVLAIRTARLAGAPGAGAGAGAGAGLDMTVSAGQLADALDAAVAAAAEPSAPSGTAAGGEPGGEPGGGLSVAVPGTVTGPPWAGVLPPRGGWARVEGLPGPDGIRAVVAASVKEFRARTEALPEEERTRAEFDRIGHEVWSRTLGTTGFPVRAAHAAQSLGFLPPLRTAAGNAAPRVAAADPSASSVPPAPEPLALLASGSWLRLRTPYGSIAVRRAGLPGLSVTPA